MNRLSTNTRRWKKKSNRVKSKSVNTMEATEKSRWWKKKREGKERREIGHNEEKTRHKKLDVEWKRHRRGKYPTSSSEFIEKTMDNTDMFV